MKGLYIALFSPFTAIKMIFKDRTLFLTCVIPIIINTVLYIGLALLLYNYYGDILSMIVKTPDTFLKKILYWISFVFFLLFALMVFILSFNIVGSILLSPFNTVIAKASYKILLSKKSGEASTAWQVSQTDKVPDLGHVIPKKRFAFLKDAYSSFKLDLKKLIFIFIPLGVLYIISFFIPFLSIIALILSFWAISYQYMDYIMEEKQIKTTERVKILFKNPVYSLAFGFVVSLAVSIPLIGLVILPSSVVGGTMLFDHLEA
jgi:CysZ protein